MEFGTTDHFLNVLKTNVMLNLCRVHTDSFEQVYWELKEQIQESRDMNEKESYLNNLESAYTRVGKELFGHNWYAKSEVDEF